MKKVEAIVNPHRLEEVKEALLEVGIIEMTVDEVRGYGRQKGSKEIYRGAEYAVDFVPKIKITLIIEADHVETAINTIVQAARSGKIGDGKIFVSSIGKTIRIRTGELDIEAI